MAGLPGLHVERIRQREDRRAEQAQPEGERRHPPREQHEEDEAREMDAEIDELARQERIGAERAEARMEQAVEEVAVIVAEAVRHRVEIGDAVPGLIAVQRGEPVLQDRGLDPAVERVAEQMGEPAEDRHAEEARDRKETDQRDDGRAQGG